MRPDSVGLFWEDAAKIKAAKVEKYKRPAPEATWERDDYLPFLEEARNFNFMHMGDVELVCAQQAGHELVYDTEVYENFFYGAFRSMQSGKSVCFEYDEEEGVYMDIAKFKWVLQNFRIVTFNGIGFDMPISSMVIAGCGNEQLKQATNLIIGNKAEGIKGIRGSEVLKIFKVKSVKELDHIDLIEVAPLRASLKVYSGRVNAPRMQDLPFNPNKLLNHEQKLITKWYCFNDLANTAILRFELRDQIELRTQLTREYDTDVRSKSDAQIAETLITKEVEALNRERVRKPVIPAGTVFRYKMPKAIKFSTPLMHWVADRVCNSMFIVQETGAIGLPEELAELKIKIADGVYRMGIGGLHSSESKVSYYASENVKIKDTDFDSFYPLIIISQHLFPPHLGPNFVRVYSSFVNRRLMAKKNKDKLRANSLKIVINGSFGKFGSCFSNLYAPDLLIQTTLTGQLILLMFIERLELEGIHVISANTDGVVAMVPVDREEDFQRIVQSVRLDTGFTTEETEYESYNARDVNNYLAIKKAKDGKREFKGKGFMSNHWHPEKKDDAIFRFHKNPQNLICTNAVVSYIRDQIPIEHTIRHCRDITQFTTVRTVDGGAVKPNRQGYVRGMKTEEIRKLPVDYHYLGKAIRFYYGRDECEDIMYAKNGNAVPRTLGAKPIMYIDGSFPEDMDFEWYEREARSILKQIAYA